VCGHFYSLSCLPFVFSSFFLLPIIINKRIRICLFLRLYSADRPPRRRLIKRCVHLSLSPATSSSFPFSRTPNATHRMGNGKCGREISSTTLMVSATENTPNRRAVRTPAPLAEPFDGPTPCLSRS
jgi:hypothetical protein